MTNNYTSDSELLQFIRLDVPTADNQAFSQLTNDPSVKKQMEQLLAESDSKNVQVDFLQVLAFQSLRAAVLAKKFEQKASLSDMYVSIFKHLLEAEPIRTGEQPLSDRILKALYTDKAVINTIKGAVKDYKHLDAQDILDNGFSLLYESIVENKFGGRCALRTYFIGICKTLILESGSSGRIKKEADGETLQVKRVIFTESFDFFDEVDDMSADFTVELEEKKAVELLRKKFIQQVLDGDKITETCKKALDAQYIQDLSMAQIAYIMNIALQSAKNQAARCREQLRKAIDEIEGLKSFLKESF
jgi:RNA polymerase sigma factor (sigma-70 family)